MTIRRTAALWLGAPPRPAMADRLKRRGLTLEVRSAPTDVDFKSSCGIVFNARGASAGSLHSLLDAYAAIALNHGLQVVIRLETTNQRLLQSRYPKLSLRWSFFDPTKRDDEDLAELLRSHEPGPAESDTLAVPQIDPPLLAEDELLLRRAFSDCDVLTLKEMTDGKSTARVLRAHAKTANHDPPGFLLPFLVKIDAADKIALEVDRYRSFVAGHIPFTQRPNLDPVRCIEGADRAVMVSDFVEDAVPLSSICERPEGRRIVYSLFDDGLRGWRRHAFAEAPTVSLPITDHLGDLLQVARITPAVRTRAKTFGLKRTPEDLAADLASHSRFPWKLGTIHGDLHPGNVMVRGAEAILIDFASIWDRKPLVADLACLEVGMCFTVAPEGCVRSVTRVSPMPFKAWRGTIDELFSLEALRRVAPQQGPQSLGWLWDACRQTRTLAAQLEATPPAYAAALALYLLRRARLGGAATQNPSVEAYALKTADRVIQLLVKGKL